MSEMRVRILMLAAAVLAQSSCGLLEPEGPPARMEGTLPGTTSTGTPLPQPHTEVPDAGGSSAPLPGYTLAWRDEFDGTALDSAKWNMDLGPWRDGLNAADALEVSDGVLTLITFTDASGVHHAGHINTEEKFEGRYGYYEARVRFGDSIGQWCSFFLFPMTIGKPVGDPGAAGVEADVFEHREVDGSGWAIADYVQVGLNWDGFGAYWKKTNLTVAHPEGQPLAGAWHDYSVLWTPEGYTFYIDELPVFQTGAAVSNIPQPMYLTCEVKDAGWAGSIPPGGFGSRDASTTTMEVDWVRAWVPADSTGTP